MSKKSFFGFKEDQLQNAWTFVYNNIISKPAFRCRIQNMSLMMFDTFTTSNAESEHAAMKNCSEKVEGNESMTNLAIKTNSQATRRTNQRVQNETKDLQCTDTKTKCSLSKVIVKRCFEALCENIELAKLCISEQTSDTSWTVFYKRETEMSGELHLHSVPVVRRKRFLSLDSDMLKCTCRMYQRFGYPCHHMFHVMDVYDTSKVKKEWIHIRWYKHYTSHYLHPQTSSRQNEIYNQLISMYPKGPTLHENYGTLFQLEMSCSMVK